jgi:hypothetical protein
MSNEETSGPELSIQHTDQVFPLTQETVTIGSGPDCNIVLDDPQVSAQHARVSWHEEEGVYLIEDLDSTEGSYVNERRIDEPQPLVNGDVIRLGNTGFDVKLEPVPDAPPGMPPEYESSEPEYTRPVVAAIVVVLLACVTIVCLAALVIAVAGGGSGTPTVVIQSPVDGARIVVGNEIILQATASGAKDITLLEMSIDGTLVASAASPKPSGASSLTVSKPWRFEAEGRYEVSAVAYTANDKTSRPESVNVEVVAAVGPTTPTPTITTEPGQPTNTPEPTATATHTPEPGETVLPPPQVEYFQASPTSITTGGCATLQWGPVSHATQARIEPDIGGVATPGSELVCPLETTTYVLTATGPGGETSASTIVTVVGGLPDLTVDSITFEPETPVAGQDNEVRITIRNKGDGAADAFNWEWQAGTDALFDGRVSGMNAGETKVVSAVWNPQSAYASLSTEARVDTDDEVAESDENNNTLSAVITVVEAETEPETVTLGSDGDLDGYWTNDGVGSTAEEIFVGNGELLDSGGELVARGFMSFDLSSIPEGATVQGVELRFFQAEVQGDPYGKLDNLLLEHVSYGDSLSDAAYNAPASDTVGLPKLTGAGTWYILSDDTVATWVEQDLVSDNDRFQLRLRFMEETDGDGEEDWISVAPGGGPLGSRSAPQLTIIYTP